MFCYTATRAYFGIPRTSMENICKETSLSEETHKKMCWLCWRKWIRSQQSLCEQQSAASACRDSQSNRQAWLQTDPWTFGLPLSSAADWMNPAGSKKLDWRKFKHIQGPFFLHVTKKKSNLSSCSFIYKTKMHTRGHVHASSFGKMWGARKLTVCARPQLQSSTVCFCKFPINNTQLKANTINIEITMQITTEHFKIFLWNMDMIEGKNMKRDIQLFPEIFFSI